jgi:hypothetical protein
MPLNVKALIYVLALSGLVFALGKGIALHFMEEEDFKRRRNIWLLLSAAAFLSPSFWVFALVAVPVLYWGGKKDTHPLAFYLLLVNIIPSIPVQIPTAGLGINQLFQVDVFRLLSFCVVVPAAWRLHKSNASERSKEFRRLDLLVLGYCMLKILLYVPPDMPEHVILQNSFTNVLRKTLLILTDIYALYYLASRSASTRRAIVDALATFCLACTVMASIAVFESLKHFLLYAELNMRWGGNPIDSTYLMRGGLLRAQASSGNALALGYLLAIATGFWLFLKTQLPKSPLNLAVTVILWLGILASYSRGPMLGALLIYFAYAALRPGGVGHLLKSVLAFVLIAGVVLASPIGDKIVDSLPFLGGKLAEGSVTYRERLLERSWVLIKAHPLLGDQLALSHLQDLRQGQGIIDLVNAYVSITLFTGFTGLVIFLAIIFSGISNAYAGSRIRPAVTADWPLLGAALAACGIGTILMLADCSFILGYVTTFFVLVGLAAGYRSGALAPPAVAMDASRSPSPEPT